MIRQIEMCVLAALLVVLMAGCAQTQVISCPTVKEYSDEFKQVFIAQYGTLVPEGTVLDTFIVDAIALRDEARACRKQ